MCRTLVVVVSFMLCGAALQIVRAANPRDDVAQAKRKAAQQFIQAGKFDDAIALLGEIVSTDSARFSDYLLLGRAYDKQGKGNEAIENYRRVLALATDKTMEERAARVESERRIRILDALRPRIDAVVEEYLRKLDALEREAESAHNTAAAERIFRLKGAVFLADGGGNRGYCEVSAGQGLSRSGFQVTAGQTYRIRARGRWRMGSGGDTECTASGFANLPFVNGGPQGALIAMVNGKGSISVLGENADFVATASGQLDFAMNEVPDQARADNSGKLYVTIERR